jgi:hypothetical protein
LVTERFLEAFSARDQLLHIHVEGTTERDFLWRYYSKHLDEQTPHLIRSIDSTSLRAHIVEIKVSRQPELLAFVREDVSETFSASNIDSVIAEVMKPRRLRLREPSLDELEAGNRDALRLAREEMLERVATYSKSTTSTILTIAAATRNPSSRAAAPMLRSRMTVQRARILKSRLTGASGSSAFRSRSAR